METLSIKHRHYLFFEVAETVYVREYKEGHSNLDDFVKASRDDSRSCWVVSYTYTDVLRRAGIPSTELTTIVPYTEARWPLEMATIMANLHQLFLSGGKPLTSMKS